MFVGYMSDNILMVIGGGGGRLKIRLEVESNAHWHTKAIIY